LAGDLHVWLEINRDLFGVLARGKSDLAVAAAGPRARGVAMRIRITTDQLPTYTVAKRDGTTVRLQGRDWVVLGVTADTMSGAAGGLGDPRHKLQYWVELRETGA
jgi:hypothetical protein